MGNHSHLWGQRAPFGSAGGWARCTKEWSTITQHDRDHTGSFTQVRAAARRKTLLLLWWIMVEMWWWSVVHLPRKGCLRVAVATRVWGCELSNLLTSSIVAMGLLL